LNFRCIFFIYLLPKNLTEVKLKRKLFIQKIDYYNGGLENNWGGIL